MRVRDLSQELVELGPRAALFRASWELRTRVRSAAGRPPRTSTENDADVGAEEDGVEPWTARLPLADPPSVAQAMRGRIGPDELRRLQTVADDALVGRIRCFERWSADFGQPVDWSLNPVTGERWPSGVVASRTLRNGKRAGDIKLTWELGRFPHAYHLARAAAFAPDRAATYAAALTDQIFDFVGANPEGYGVHWHQGRKSRCALSRGSCARQHCSSEGRPPTRPLSHPDGSRGRCPAH